MSGADASERGPTRVVVVEDHAMVRDGLVAALALDDGLRVEGAASDVASGARLVVDRRPDVVITDYDLGDGTAVDLKRRVDAALGYSGDGDGDGDEDADADEHGDRDEDERPRYLVITGLGQRGAVAAVVGAGCSGLVPKGQGVDVLLAAVRTVAAGGVVLPARSLGDLRGPSGARAADLTPREREVLQLLADARTAGEIAVELVISVNTVRNHIRSLLAKLSARSQLEAVVLGARAGLVTVGDAPGPLAKWSRSTSRDHRS